jgi:hypothetical protein
MGYAGALGIDSMASGLLGSELERVAAQDEARQNKQMADAAAADALQRGEREAGQARAQTSQLVGAQNVAYAGSGVDASVGTAANVQAATRAMGELDARTLENNAAREAWGFRTYGVKYQQQAQLANTRARIGTAATILGGVGRLASSAGSSYARDAYMSNTGSAYARDTYGGQG